MPVMTAMAHLRDPSGGVPVANAIPMGSTARSTLKIPAAMIRPKYALRNSSPTNPTATAMQNRPATMVL